MLLRTLTLNVWGLPTSPDRAYRIAAIGEQLAALALDIVGLQEVWLEEDRQRIRNAASSGGLRHAQFYPSGIMGSGLLVLSRYPIVDADFRRFRLTGRPEKVWQADYYGGKGIALARVETPAGLLNVFNTHAVAQYAPDAEDEYRAHRVAELYECARYIDASSATHPAILMGDLNTRPDQPGYAVVTALAGLRDSFATVHPGDTGATISPENPYKRGLQEGYRIDYIFVRDGEEVGLTVSTAAVAMTLLAAHAPGGETIAYSDHFGVLAEAETGETAPPPAPDAEATRHILTDLSAMLGEGLAEAQPRRASHLVQMGAGAAAIPGAYVAGKRVASRRQFMALLLRVGMIAAVPYTALQSWLSLCVVPDEIQALAALKGEIDRQLEARRAFNGVRW